MSIRRRNLILSAFVGVLIAAFLVAGPGLAYPPGTAMTVTGSNGTITVSNGQPGCVVTVYEDGKKVGSETISSDGTAVFKTTTTPGAKLTAEVTGGAGCEAESAKGTVSGTTPTPTPSPTSTSTSTPTPSPTPSHTGSDSLMFVLIGLGALGVGGGLVSVARRRRS